MAGLTNPSAKKRSSKMGRSLTSNTDLVQRRQNRRQESANGAVISSLRLFLLMGIRLSSENTLDC